MIKMFKNTTLKWLMCLVCENKVIKMSYFNQIFNREQFLHAVPVLRRLWNLKRVKLKERNKISPKQDKRNLGIVVLWMKLSRDSKIYCLTLNLEAILLVPLWLQEKWYQEIAWLPQTFKYWTNLWVLLSDAEHEIIDLLSPSPLRHKHLLSKDKNVNGHHIDIIELSESETEMSSEHVRKAKEFRSFLATIEIWAWYALNIEL